MAGWLKIEGVEEIYSLIKRKEDRYGNVLTQKYYQVEHSSELFALR
jgi:hypothetical protein